LPGLSSREIGAALYFTEAAVESCRARIMDKIGQRGVIAIVRYAYMNGIVRMDEV